MGLTLRKCVIDGRHAVDGPSNLLVCEKLHRKQSRPSASFHLCRFARVTSMTRVAQATPKKRGENQARFNNAATERLQSLLWAA
jgi:hypothetical protein